MKIANIPIAVVVGGQRRVIPVGAEIPADLPAHDVRALAASGALHDSDAAAQRIATLAADQKRAAAEFDAARQAAREAADSVKPVATDDPGTCAAGAGAIAPSAPAAATHAAPKTSTRPVKK